VKISKEETHQKRTARTYYKEIARAYYKFTINIFICNAKISD